MQAGTDSTRGGLSGTLNMLHLPIGVPLPSGGLHLPLAHFLSPHPRTLWLSTVSASLDGLTYQGQAQFTCWFAYPQLGHTPSSTTVPEGRPRKATFSHASSRADPSPSKICRTATVGSWPLGVGGGSEAGQQRNSTGALALLVFLGGPCNTISKYKSKSIKGADTLPPSPSSAHLYSSIPQSLCLGDPKREE